MHSSIAYEHFVNPNKKKEFIEVLTSLEASGRASGSDGAIYVRNFIKDEFEKAGLKPFRGEFIQEFPVNIPKSSRGNESNIKGYNVIGYLPSHTRNNDYIVIGAHYDHMGTLDGNLYPGADDNASGVAMLLELAKIFGNISQTGLINKNIVFVAFDANNHNNAGSKFFVSEFGHPYNKISSMINLGLRECSGRRKMDRKRMISS